MQKTVYICDHCKRIIGDVIHISLSIAGPFSGIAIPPEVAVLPCWTIPKEQRVAGFYHFHLHCIEKYFMKMAKPYLNQK